MHREFKWLVQGHPPIQWQSWDSNPSSLAPFCCLTASTILFPAWWSLTVEFYKSSHILMLPYLYQDIDYSWAWIRKDLDCIKHSRIFLFSIPFFSCHIWFFQGLIYSSMLYNLKLCKNWHSQMIIKWNIILWSDPVLN